MDWGKVRSEIPGFWKKYRLVLLVLLAGLCLMMIPEQKKEPIVTELSQISQASVEESLAAILSKIKGAGKVEVLLTEYQGKETIYQTDGQQSADSLRQETVILSGSDREEEGLVRQVNPPVYLGALIVCQGGDNPTVKLSIVEAVMDITGLSSNQITVLKMK